jgi:hypothetical protein
LVERKSRLVYITKLQRKSATETNKAVPLGERSQE